MTIKLPVNSSELRWVSWAWDVFCHAGPCMQKDPTLGLFMGSVSALTILIIFEQGTLNFHFGTGPHRLFRWPYKGLQISQVVAREAGDGRRGEIDEGD